MKAHWDFFKESDTSFGLFYPLHYVVAAFDDFEQAETAKSRFLSEGFSVDDVATASGPFVVEQLESEEGAAWFDRLRAGIARIVGTEAGFLDDDVQLARRGGAFLFVYTPDDHSADTTRSLIDQLQPIFARRYHRAGIERIRYPPQSEL